MKAVIDEYRLRGGRCSGYSRHHPGTLPMGVPRNQPGPWKLSVIGVLGTRYHLTQRKIRPLLAPVMGLSFNVGAISQTQGKVSHALQRPVAKAIRPLPTASGTVAGRKAAPARKCRQLGVGGAAAKVGCLDLVPCMGRLRYQGHHRGRLEGGN